MIASNELRIGNTVGIYTGDEWVKYKEIIDHEDLAENSCAEYYPIPLSAEILEKAGFEKSGMLYIHPSTMNFEIWNRAKAEGVTRWYAGRMQKDYFLGISNEIKYLHQLQNLYFALTGEELPVEL